jgi:hypothetical protein
MRPVVKSLGAAQESCPPLWSHCVTELESQPALATTSGTGQEQPRELRAGLKKTLELIALDLSPHKSRCSSREWEPRYAPVTLRQMEHRSISQPGILRGLQERLCTVLRVLLPAGEHVFGKSVQVTVDELRAGLAQPNPVRERSTLRRRQEVIESGTTGRRGRYVGRDTDIHRAFRRGVGSTGFPSAIGIRAPVTRAVGEVAHDRTTEIVAHCFDDAPKHLEPIRRFLPGRGRPA